MILTYCRRFCVATLIVAATGPVVVAQPGVCPANTLFSQPPDENCTAGTSEAGSGFRRWERFTGVAGPVTGIRWWGLAARPFNGTFIACEENDQTFEITIAHDVAGAPGPVACTYTLVATRTLTETICGENDDSPPVYEYQVTLPAPCILVRGWVSIVGYGDSTCWFLWYASSAGDGTSRCEGCANNEGGFDLSLCLLGTPGGVNGACCNESTGVCTDNVAINNCTAAVQRFTPNTLCANIDPPCGQLVGPCCRADAPCAVQIELDCLAAGGLWLGLGATCNDCPAYGACCQGASHCVVIEQAPCVSEGHTWLGANTTCAECPSLPTCPTTGVLVSQPPHDPIAEPSAYTSENASVFRRSENFSGVTGPISALTWWGLDMRPVGNGFVECVEGDNTFNIVFSHDAAGQPGGQVCSYNLVATRTPTGHTYNGAQLNEYHVDLPSPCVLTRGWVTIVGLGDETCWFLWMSSPIGDNLSHCSGCTVGPASVNLAVCLHGTPGGVFGACCDDTLVRCFDNVEITNCAAPNQRFTPNGTCAFLDPPCGTVFGACCFAQLACGLATEANCQAGGGLWLGANALCSACPCIVGCPAGAHPEGEPLCVTNYVDNYNAGCTRTPHNFTPVAFGDTICGVGGFYESGGNYGPDQDWYEIQIPAVVGWNVQITAEMPIRVEIREAGEGCPGTELSSTQSPVTCTPASLNAFSENPGTHWIVVTTYVPNDLSACGGKYTLQVISPNGCIPGDMNVDTRVNGSDIQPFAECIVTGSSPFGCICGDMNFDNATNPGDVPLFVARLLQP